MNERKRTLPNTLMVLAITLILHHVPCAIDAAEARKGPASWKFAVMSDTQGDDLHGKIKSCINKRIVKDIAKDIAREHVDLVLVSGDLVNGWIKNGGKDYSVQYAEWKKAMDPVYSAGIKVYPVRGNHDEGPDRVALPPLPSGLEPSARDLAGIRKAYAEAFNQPYIPQNGPDGEKGLTYSFIHNNALIIGLDTYSCGQHRVNIAWLQKQLAGSKGNHVFVFGHEPAFDADNKTTLALYPKDRDVFWNTITGAGARIYFCGHDHFYSRVQVPAKRMKTWQIINGTGGGMLRKWTDSYLDRGRVIEEYQNNEHHGYVVVTVEGPKATVVWKALVKHKKAEYPLWQVLDTLSYDMKQ